MTTTPDETRPIEVQHVAGVPFQVTNLLDAVDWVVNVAAIQHRPVNVRLANAWNVALAHDDADYRELLTAHGINLPDGSPVIWFMNWQRHRARSTPAGRVRGPSLFTQVMEQSVRSGTRHFLLGGSQATLDALVEALHYKYPGVRVVGTYSPPFAPVTDDYIADCVDHITSSQPDLVWVGLGTPKQDIVGTALASELSVTTLNVGAAFGFTAGTVGEAPQWMQRSGLEWLYRLTSEPRRLWYRYTYGNVRFLYVAIRHQLHLTSTRGR